ncbi:MAG: hypothetical protein K1Y02_13265, partial [Candidatus Hydrogenedentes bacterium]|nr:hypothetical protein [Candidatus Hydrogenedentota bacterium]
MIPFYGNSSRGASRTLIVVAIAITLFWGMMVALLLRREVFLPRLASLSVTNPAFSAVASDTWMGIYFENRQVGTVNVRTTPGTRNGEEGVTVSLNSHLRLNMLGESNDLNVTGNAWFARLSGLAGFYFELRSGEHKTEVTATIADGLLKADVNSGGERFPVEWPIKDNVALWNSMGTSTLNVPAMTMGQVYLVDTFDPMTMSLTQARMTFIAEEPLLVEGKLITTRVVSTDISGINSKAWVTDTGEVVKAETPLGFTLLRMSA